MIISEDGKHMIVSRKELNLMKASDFPKGTHIICGKYFINIEHNKFPKEEHSVNTRYNLCPIYTPYQPYYIQDFLSR